MKCPYYTYSDGIIPSRTLFRVFGMHAKDPNSFLITKELAGLKERCSFPSVFNEGHGVHNELSGGMNTQEIQWFPAWTWKAHTSDSPFIQPLASCWHRTDARQLSDDRMNTVGFRSVWRQWKKQMHKNLAEDNI